MKHKISPLIRPAILPVLGLILSDCQRGTTDSPNFRIMVLSDTHISDNQEKSDRLKNLVRMVNMGEILNIDMVFITGDIVSSVYGRRYTPENPDTSDNWLGKAMNIFRQFDKPHYLAMGNHDHKIAKFRDSDAPWGKAEINAMGRLWKRQTGFDSNYSIYHDGWKFIVLNSMGGEYLERHFDEAQIDFLNRELADEMPTILFFHHPLQSDHIRPWCKLKDLARPESNQLLYTLLWNRRDQIKTIFVGHGHTHVDDVLYDQIRVIETESFADGNNSSYNIVTINPKGERLSVMKGSRLTH